MPQEGTIHAKPSQRSVWRVAARNIAKSKTFVIVFPILISIVFAYTYSLPRATSLNSRSTNVQTATTPRVTIGTPSASPVKDATATPTSPSSGRTSQTSSPPMTSPSSSSSKDTVSSSGSSTPVAASSCNLALQTQALAIRQEEVDAENNRYQASLSKPVLGGIIQMSAAQKTAALTLHNANLDTIQQTYENSLIAADCN